MTGAARMRSPFTGAGRWYLSSLAGSFYSSLAGFSDGSGKYPERST